MNFTKRIATRIGDWLGLELDPEPTDPLASALRPYEHADHQPRFETLRADCEHWWYQGVDSAPPTPDKVWECAGCGWLFRIVVNPQKPWFVRELVQVDDLTASHAVSAAAVDPTPSAAVASDALHIDLLDAS